MALNQVACPAAYCPAAACPAAACTAAACTAAACTAAYCTAAYSGHLYSCSIRHPTVLLWSLAVGWSPQAYCQYLMHPHAPPSVPPSVLPLVQVTCTAACSCNGTPAQRLLRWSPRRCWCRLHPHAPHLLHLPVSWSPPAAAGCLQSGHHPHPRPRRHHLRL
jgi:hypothetical protein